MAKRGSLLGSSIGRKALMAITGTMLCCFLVLHLLGNIVLLLDDDGSLTLSPGGPHSSEFFQWVAEHYEAVPLLFHTGELMLLALFGTHAALGVTLWWQNRKARGPRGYVRQGSEGGRTLASATMPYTGVLFIGAFIVAHLINFRFGEQSNPAELYDLVVTTLSSWLWAAVYLAALLGLFLHLSHGAQSLFQSLGLNHTRHTPRVKAAGTLFAILIASGFAIIPILLIANGGGR